MVPVMVTGYLCYNKGRDALLKSTGQSLEMMADTVADALDRNLYHRYREVQTLGYHPDMKLNLSRVGEAADFFARRLPTTTWCWLRIRLVKLWPLIVSNTVGVGCQLSSCWDGM